MGRALSFAAIILCLIGALLYAPKIDRSAIPALSAPLARPDPAGVEKALGEAERLSREGRRVEAVLFLQRAAASEGSLRGAALFLLGEEAFSEKAFSKALENYALALKADPGLSDAFAPFQAGKTMLARARELKEGGTAGYAPDAAGTAKINYLIRKLTGGCK